MQSDIDGRVDCGGGGEEECRKLLAPTKLLVVGDKVVFCDTYTLHYL